MSVGHAKAESCCAPTAPVASAAAPPRQQRRCREFSLARRQAAAREQVRLIRQGAWRASRHLARAAGASAPSSAAQRRLTVWPPGAQRRLGRTWNCLFFAPQKCLMAEFYEKFCFSHNGVLASRCLTFLFHALESHPFQMFQARTYPSGFSGGAHPEN